MTMRRRRMGGGEHCHLWLLLLLLLLATVWILPVVHVQAWIPPSSSSSCSSLRLFKSSRIAVVVSTPKILRDDSEHDQGEDLLVTATTTTRRRLFLINHLPSALALLLGASTTSMMMPPPEPSQAAAVQAVGSAESACRLAGNCLETGQWDGAVGWNWGGKDRCDAADPRCGVDGKLRDGDIIGKPVPRPPPVAVGGGDAPRDDSPSSSASITHVANLRIDVGREESGILRLGFYGRDAPGSVQQLVDFLSENGLSTEPSNADDILGTLRVPVGLNRGGVVDSITPGATIDFGVPSQSNAYARSRGTSKVPAGFVPQPRPSPSVVENDAPFIRSHSEAGLVSVSKKGLGYGGTGFETDDEAFESAFLITAASDDDNVAKSLDKNRRVIGQVLDNQSMAFLERLSTVPTKRGIRGVIPGQTSGPPLIKVVVREATVAKVVSR